MFSHVVNNNTKIDSKEILEKISYISKLVSGKDVIIKQLAEKVKVLEEKINQIEETHHIVEDEDETNKTFLNPFLTVGHNCEKCDFETQLETELMEHMERNHLENVDNLSTLLIK